MSKSLDVGVLVCCSVATECKRHVAAEFQGCLSQAFFVVLATAVWAEEMACSSNCTGSVRRWNEFVCD